jgi:hypothetical protein
MNKIHYLVPLKLGLGLTSVTILPGLAQQGAFATCKEHDSFPPNANPSCMSQGNTSGTENMTMLSENIPMANMTGIGEIPGTEDWPLDMGHILD